MTTTIVQNSFLPTSILGCKLWVDGADPAGTGVAPANGSTVSSWKDKSGLGNNATSAGSAVTYSSAGLSFGGSSYYSVPGIAGTIVNTPFVIFIVETLTGSGANSLYFGDDNVNNSGAYGYSLHTGYRNSTNQTFAMYGSDLEDTTVSGIGNTRIWALYLPTASNRNTRRNGTVDVTFSNYNRLLAFTAPVIGRSFGGAYYIGTISEIIVYNQDIGLTAIQQVEGYLAWKWGQQVNLPSTHPYKNTPAVITTQPNILANLSITNRVNNAAFLPTQIPACTLWMDGADPAGTGVPPVNGATVSSWKDKSGTGNNFTGSATYTLDSVYNKYGLYFDGANNYFLQANGSLYSITNTTYTIFTAHRFTTNGSPTTAYEVYRSSNLNLFFFRQVNGAIQWLTDIDGAGYVSVNGTGAANSGIGCINTLTTSSATAYLNGTSVGSASRGTTTNVAFAIGVSASGLLEKLVGVIFEMIIYNTTLSTTQQQQIEGYLAWKWGIQAKLPLNHPYKNTSAVFVTQPSILAALAVNPYNNMIAYKYFNPTSIVGCQLWLDAADPSTITGTSSVTAWRDKSGNGNNGTASGTPVLLANSINGSYPSIYFNGSSSIAGATANSGTTLTAFCVLQTTDANLNTNGRLLSLSTPGQNDYASVQQCIPYNQFNPTYINTNRGNTGTVQITYDVPIGTSALVATIFDGNTSNIFYGNGSLFAISTAPSWNTNFSITTYCIGNGINPNTAWYKGRIGEIILYSTALSNQQRQQVEGYLAWKWGLQVKLPATHAYKNYPPPPN